ncbi:MAG: TetM/TetW/TetO/TetS family tetracycline resistance ribosomal protection protein [Oscillospiraceae bacterium]|nr:TetM/TetW/TetO/TetS family tetracycline resistance ribosomal protection protein [Oscillospiraceae bacterium]
MYNAGTGSPGPAPRHNIAVGMLAHVDAGKTTLTEAMLYKSGAIRRLGRVDHQNAFLDTGEMERKRGITIFAKQAVMPLGEMSLTLLDTPGHVDFSTEAERVLQVLDYAILVINGSDGVQGHTATLWQLLERYAVPVFIFINKTDLPGADRDKLMAELKNRLHSGCVLFSGRDRASLDEDIAMCGDDALSEFLEKGFVSDEMTAVLIRRRGVFPCFFGSALKMDGIEEFLSGLEAYILPVSYPARFGAKVYKISRDSQNNRLTHLKITGGAMAVKSALTGAYPAAQEAADGDWTEKVNQIRIYSGEKFTQAQEAAAGTVCAVTGLNYTYPGQGLGIEQDSRPPVLEPAISYRVIFPEGCDPHTALQNFRRLEEEDPQLKISYSGRGGDIHLQLMGEIQLEILSHTVLERFGLEVGFGEGEILYRETIKAPVIGMGHFEPLRHYAEVHLLLEPGERGSGLVFASMCSEDVLHRSWQRLVLAHLAQRAHPGVLTGAPVTDIKITLLTGRAHNKHTVGGDFRQATYRALRQGLMQAENILLEPWHKFRLEVPGFAAGRASADLRRMSDDVKEENSADGRTLITGSAPVALLRGYNADVNLYTRGMGQFSCSFGGFAPCRDQKGIIAKFDYDAGSDTENPADSVFCSHGSGFIVKWDRVKAHMHMDSGYVIGGKGKIRETAQAAKGKEKPRDIFALDKELMEIYERAYGPIKSRDILPSQKRPRRDEPPEYRPTANPKISGPDYLLVDGYNIIHAWEDLRAVAAQNMDGARQILMNILSNYQGFTGREIILVFDAYKVAGDGGVERFHGISAVYTKEAETADTYIEKASYKLGKKHRVTVATSDGAVQLIIMSHGAVRMSPENLREEIDRVNEEIMSRQ